MMKNCLLLSLLFIGMAACKKNDKLTKSEPYKNLVYRVQSNGSNLQLYLIRLTYIDTIQSSRNIGKDTILPAPSLYNIPALVLKGSTITLTGISTTDSTFNLKIVDEDGTILAQTDTLSYHPITALDTVERWISSISVHLD